MAFRPFRFIVSGIVLLCICGGWAHHSVSSLSKDLTGRIIIPNKKTDSFNLRINAEGDVNTISVEAEAILGDKLEVPSEYTTIQAAIVAASNGDEIVVSPGTYYENINFLGKNISVVSLYHSTGNRNYIENTIIDGSRPTDITKASVVTFTNGESSLALLSGFTIRGGTGTYTKLPGNPFINYFGGGIFCVQANPTIQNLIIRENSLTSPNGSGGGVLVSNAAPTLKNLFITENKVSAGLYLNKVNNPSGITAHNIRVTKSIDSDGIYISTSIVKLKNITIEECNGLVATGLFSMYSTVELDSGIITGNKRGVDVRANTSVTIRNTAITDSGTGGGIWCNSTSLQLINTTIAGNALHNHYGGAGIFINDGSSKIALVNSILYNNSWTELNTGIVRQNSISFLDDGGELTVAYSNLQGGQQGLHFFDGSGNIVVNWLTGNINSDPLFFKAEKSDYHLSSGSPSDDTGIAHFEYAGTTYVDLTAGEYEGGRPDMGAYLFGQPYVKALFSSNKTTGNLPLVVQFTDESYGFKTTPLNTWTWDFGDGTSSVSRNPIHQFNATGVYTVKLRVQNNAYEDTEVKIALIKVFDSDTLYVATNGINSPAGGTKNSPFKTIQYGIDHASNGDVILVKDGLYKENVNFNGRNVHVSSYYLIDGAVQHITSTLIDGNNHGTVVVFKSGESMNAGLTGLTIQNGFADGDNYPGYYGGGVFIENSSPTLKDVMIKNNKTNYRGGGIFIDNGDPVLERITISSNQSVYSYSEGAGIYMSSSQAVITDSKITSNNSNHNGGGLFLGYEAAPELQNVTISGNTASNAGGGLCIESNNLVLSKMSILNNTASIGGGVYSSFSNNTINYSVIANNNATTEGGGFYYLGNAANPKLDKVTLYNNQAPAGSSIQLNFTAKVYVSNSIIWNASGSPIAGTAYATYSDIKGGLTGTGNINADPKFLNASGNDYSLDLTSPCIDAGDPASIADPNGTRADMGAFYYDRPIIVDATQVITMVEDVEKVLRLSDFVVKNGGNGYPGDFVLDLSPGANYTISGNTIKPAANYYGPITVPVKIKSSTTSSQSFQLDINVAPVNDAPVITNHVPITLSWGDPLTLYVTFFTFTDVDTSPAGPFTLKVLDGPNYTRSGNTIFPIPTFTGFLKVRVVISDGVSDSAPYECVIVVVVIDQLVITGQNGVSMEEDHERPISLSDLTYIPEPFVQPITLRLSAGVNYTLSGQTVIPDPDFTGVLSVPVVLIQSSTSNTFMLKIEVTPVNDAPVILDSREITIEADEVFTLSLSDLTIIDPDNPFTELELIVLAGPGYTVNGNTITPSPTAGPELQVSVQVNDGALNSEIFPLTVNILAVTAIEELRDARLQLYPNPAGEYLRIEYNSLSDVESMVLVSVGGTLQILKPSYESDCVIIPLKQLANGSYILYIRTVGGEELRRKVVIAR